MEGEEQDPFPPHPFLGGGGSLGITSSQHTRFGRVVGPLACWGGRSASTPSSHPRTTTPADLMSCMCLGAVNLCRCKCKHPGSTHSKWERVGITLPPKQCTHVHGAGVGDATPPCRAQVQGPRHSCSPRHSTPVKVGLGGQCKCMCAPSKVSSCVDASGCWDMWGEAT